MLFNGGCTGACFAIDVYSTATVEKLSFKFRITIHGNFIEESDIIEIDISCALSNLTITPSFNTDQVWNVDYADTSAAKYFVFAPFTASPAACFVGSYALEYEMSFTNALPNSAVTAMTLDTCNSDCTNG